MPKNNLYILINNPILVISKSQSMNDIFLSYSKEDSEYAKKFVQLFEKEGLKVWWDHSIHMGCSNAS